MKLFGANLSLLPLFSLILLSRGRRVGGRLPFRTGTTAPD